MAFTIEGRDRGRFVSMSRVRAGSAGVLAQSWLKLGFDNVRISYNGRWFDPEGFMAQFVMTSAGLKPRNGDIRTW